MKPEASSHDDNEDTSAPAARPRHTGISALIRMMSAALWVALTLISVAVLAGDSDNPLFDGNTDGLAPYAERQHHDDLWLLVEYIDVPGSTLSAAPLTHEHTSELLAAALSVAQALGDERVPLAPPANAVSSWLDKHGLFLLPDKSLPQLEEKLSNEHLSESVQSVRARLSSPLFGVTGTEARRDPLGIGGLIHNVEGQLGHVHIRDHAPRLAQPTGSGELLAADGKSILLLLRSDRNITEIQTGIDQALQGHSVIASLIGTVPNAERNRMTLRRNGHTVLQISLGLLIAVIAVVSRGLRPVLVHLLVISGVLVMASVLLRPIDTYTLPILGILAAVAASQCIRSEAKAFDSRLGHWSLAAILATSLLPLAYSPYPVWQNLSWVWLITVAALTLFGSALVRLLSNRLGYTCPTPSAIPLGFSTAQRAASIVLIVGVAIATWSLQHASYQGIDRITRHDQTTNGLHNILSAKYFDPRHLAEFETHGESKEAALEQAAKDAPSLARLIPTQVVRLDHPGSFVVTETQIMSRRHLLAEQGLQAKTQRLHDALESQGLRPEAFTESLNEATDLRHLPNATEALKGALGPWISRYFVSSGEAAFSLRGTVSLFQNQAVPVVYNSNDQLIEFRGPIVVSQRDESVFLTTLVMVCAGGLWLGAFFSWLSTRDLPLALVSACCAAAAQACTLVVLTEVFDAPLSPLILPPLLLVGSLTFLNALPACQAVRTKSPVALNLLMVCGLCFVLAGLGMFLSTHVIAQTIGFALALGSAIATGFGVFVAPSILSTPPSKTPDGGQDND